MKPLDRRLLLIAGLSLTLAPRVGRAAETPVPITFADLYKPATLQGLEFTDKIVGLSGKPVSIKGFMAPPLKAEADFFVLTRTPVSLCPFCDSDASWPIDIVVIHLRESAGFTSPYDGIQVVGRLETGSKMDPKTGFVSLLRVVDAEYRLA
ncbi:MAG TPA: hypothetical protein VNT30_10280 [Stellaceae bacterium]|nr:hypothetical protein [Stellaceae bacterium]